MVRLGRFELPTSCFGGTRSIHLSYSRTPPFIPRFQGLTLLAVLRSTPPKGHKQSAFSPPRARFSQSCGCLRSYFLNCQPKFFRQSGPARGRL
jgi:hypothetical protein